MTNTGNNEIFKLSTGGPIYRLLTLLRIQKTDAYSVRRRLVILIGLSWLPLFLLTFVEGNLINSHLDQPFIYDIKSYIRYLFVIPLLVIADGLIDPLIATNIQSIGSSGILGEEHKEWYRKAIDRLRRRKESTLADVVIILIIALITISIITNLEDLDVSLEFTNWITQKEGAELSLTVAGWWYFVVSSPILQIILFRWFWRFLIWGEFLFNVSRVKLKLQPTHPDLAGGLGILKNGESAFILIFIAFGSMLSVSLVEEILFTDFTLEQAYPIIVIYIVIAIFLLTLPLLFFTRQLVAAKRRGRVTYGGLGYKLSRAFDKKWGDTSDPATGDELLKTADSSAVCDYADIFEAVREMRYLPISLKDYMTQALVLLTPFLPLALTQFSASELFSRLIDTLI
jgi:hypothetical protein